MPDSFKIPIRPDIVFMNPRGEVPGNGGKAETVTIPFKLEFSTSLLAKFEIGQLTQRPDLRRLLIVGPGSLTPEQVEENKQRETEFDQLRLEIIKKHGLEEEYLTPLIKKRERLWAELVEVNQEIAKFRT